MTCDEAEVLLHALIDGELDAGHARDVETHIAGCQHCAAALSDYREMINGGGMSTTMETTPVPGVFSRAETRTEVDLRGGLIGLTLQQLVGSAGGLRHADHDAYAAETYGGPQYAIGLGLRGGYRLW